MDSLIETFHIDIKLLIAQVINFAIVFFVLYIFALKPLMKTMQERTKKIEKSLTDADRIEQKLKAAEEEAKEVISNAKKDAGAVMEKAVQRAEEKKSEMIEKAKEEIGQIINKEKEKIQQEKEIVLKEIKAEITNIVIAVTEKVIGEKIDEKADREMIKKAIEKK